MALIPREVEHKARGFCRHTILDSDGDNIPDCVDCAPSDPNAWAVPPEVTGDRFMADKITWFWPSLAPISGPGTTYDLVSDAFTGLPVGPGGGGESSACGHGSPSFAVVATPSPAGTGFWLLARGHNVCGPGPYGNERHNTVPPFPATPPRVTTTCP